MLSHKQVSSHCWSIDLENFPMLIAAIHNKCDHLHANKATTASLECVLPVIDPFCNQTLDGNQLT